MFVRLVCLNIGIHVIHEIQQMCKIYLPKYQNAVPLCEIRCLKVKLLHADAHRTIYYWHYEPDVISCRRIVTVCLVSGFQFLRL